MTLTGRCCSSVACWISALASRKPAAHHQDSGKRHPTHLSVVGDGFSLAFFVKVEKVSVALMDSLKKAFLRLCQLQALLENLLSPEEAETMMMMMNLEPKTEERLHCSFVQTCSNPFALHTAVPGQSTPGRRTALSPQQL